MLLGCVVLNGGWSPCISRAYNHTRCDIQLSVFVDHMLVLFDGGTMHLQAAQITLLPTITSLPWIRLDRFMNDVNYSGPLGPQSGLRYRLAQIAQTFNQDDLRYATGLNQGDALDSFIP